VNADLIEAVTESRFELPACILGQGFARAFNRPAHQSMQRRRE